MSRAIFAVIVGIVLAVVVGAVFWQAVEWCGSIHGIHLFLTNAESWVPRSAIENVCPMLRT